MAAPSISTFPRRVAMRILVVDDEPDVAELITLAFNLRWQDCEVIAAGDGETALKRFEEQQPDVVVLDVGLPGISGFDVCRRLRERSDVPILILTIDLGESKVVVRGESIRLTPIESRLLSHLVNNAGRVVPHDVLLARVWGVESH